MRKSILAPRALALLIGMVTAAAIAALPTDEPPFDPATVVSLRLEVTEVRHDATEGRNDVHLVARAGDRQYDVHVGPQWFVSDAGWSFATQEVLLVTGSEVQRDGEPALIAVSIERGDATLQLRDDNGQPLWAGGRRGSAQEAAAASRPGMGHGGMHQGGMRGMGEGMPGQGRQGMGMGMGMMCMRADAGTAQQGEQGEAAQGEAPAAMCPCRRSDSGQQRGPSR